MMGVERKDSGSQPYPDDGAPLDPRRSESAEDTPRPIYQRPARRGRFARWLAEMRCLALGHVWRESRHFEDYQTCTRCHARRRSPR